MNLKKNKTSTESLQNLVNSITHSFSDCSLCNLCCIDGVLYLDEYDIKKISNYLKINPKSLVENYTSYNVKTDEIKIDMPCSFLKDNKCMIYPIRPQVCRNYPIFVQNDFVYVYGVETCAKSTIFLDKYLGFLLKFYPDCYNQFKTNLDKDRPLKKNESINIKFSKEHVELFIKWMDKIKKN